MSGSNQGYPTSDQTSGMLPDAYGTGSTGSVIVPTGAITNVDGSDKQFVIDYTTSTVGISGNTVNINGGNDQFVILVDSPAAAQAAQNTINVEGGDNKFVIDFKSSSTDASQNNHNVVNVGGGNNQFVVQYDDSAGHSGTPTGNDVTVNGGNNSFVVSYQYPTVSATPGDQVQVTGGNNEFVVAHSNGSTGPYDFGALNNGASGGSSAIPVLPTGTFVGTTLPPASSGVTVDGTNNQYVVANVAGSAGDAASTVISGSSAVSAAAASGLSMLGHLADTTAASPGSGSDLTELLGQSPFGALLNLPGVTPETLFGNLGGSGGANPFGDIPAGSNPFTNYPGSTGPFSTATSAGSTAAPAYPGTGSAASGSGADNSDLTALLGQSPFGALLNLPGVTPETLFGNLGGSGGANPFGNIPAGSNPFTNYPGSTGPFSTATSAGGAAMSAYPTQAYPGTAAASGSGANNSDLTALLGQSPFGALLNLPGVTPETLFGSLGGSGTGANPFGDIPAGSNPFTNYPGSTSPFSIATSAGATVNDALSALASGGGGAAAASLLPAAFHGLI